MSCFGTRVRQDLYDNCCNGNTLCQFDGDLCSVSTAPVYVQQVFDAVRFHLQGMKTFNDQVFHPSLPAGHRIKRVVDIRCRRVFHPNNIENPSNLTLDLDTSISGATFLRDGQGKELKVVGVDGTYSERIMYAETSDCDSKCQGTPVFGTQSVSIYGNVYIELDLLLGDSCNNEELFTVCAEVNLATEHQPMVLTNFFEICMPSTIDTAFLPRFTEFCNSACEARLATNNCGRDLNVDCNGQISGNLIVAICLTCEKKIVVPVQLCVLTTGYAQAPLQQNAICTGFPSLFPASIQSGTSVLDQDPDADPDRQCCQETEAEDSCCTGAGSGQSQSQSAEESRQPRRPQPRR